MRRLERYKTDAGKRKRVQRKINRSEEQELRGILIISLLMLHIRTGLWYKYDAMT